MTWDSSPYFASTVMTDIQREYLTIPDLARIEGVSRARAYQMVQQYNLEVVKLGPRITLIPVTEIRKIPTREERAKHTGGQPYHKKNRQNGTPE